MVQPRGLQYRADDEGKGHAGHPKLVTLSWKNSNDGKQDTDIVVRLPLPYALPPVKYGPKGELALASLFSLHFINLCLMFLRGLSSDGFDSLLFST